MPLSLIQQVPLHVFNDLKFNPTALLHGPEKSNVDISETIGIMSAIRFPFVQLSDIIAIFADRTIRIRKPSDVDTLAINREPIDSWMMATAIGFVRIFPE